MEKITKILSITLLSTTMICGFWLTSQEGIEASSITFHQITSLSGIIFTLFAFLLKDKVKNNAK